MSDTRRWIPEWDEKWARETFPLDCRSHKHWAKDRQDHFGQDYCHRFRNGSRNTKRELQRKIIDLKLEENLGDMD